MAKLAANNLKEIRSKVAFILNYYPSTRNSDISLAYKYWETFEPENMPKDGRIDIKSMFSLERMISIIRARAKIQNEYGLFQADEKVKNKRMSKNSKQRERELEDKPRIPVIIYYLDESGKNQKYLVVGGLCITEGYSSYTITNQLMKWKDNNKINHEFHFTELTKAKLENYKSFFAEALSHADFIGFKAVAILKEGSNKDIDQLVNELHYQIIHIGSQHEVDTKRITLPRKVVIYKDKEEGIDRLFMTNLGEELTTGFRKHFDNMLQLEILDAVDSKANLLIQLADLYIGSISRILNRDEDGIRNQKDEFAEFVISILDMDIGKKEYSHQDIAFLKIL